MKKAIKIFVVVLFIGIAGLQFVRPERTNPPVIDSQRLEKNVAVPADVGSVLARSCNDCHSNETKYPWYSNIAPISWSVVDHVRVGREELNFSVWSTYSKQRRLRKLEEICEEIESRHMPHNQYLWAHWDAELTDSEIRSVCSWTQNVYQQIESASP